ncbi:hypothetical protein WJX81_003637 [Elliptochloris bilobata]|uniref:RING-type E3 ubiquitin transferase n=1 Tax=Elliptochloris bilobata TaxID=381761 RepID=A0AAW1R0E7_9CHLO
MSASDLPAAAGNNTDGEEEDTCRICRVEGSPDDPLFTPCLCSGSMRYVHSHCLESWLDHSKRQHCEVCKHPISFTPVFAPNAPATLPLSELLLGLGRSSLRACKSAVRVYIVAVVWLNVVPLLTSYMWRLAFSRSLQQGVGTVLDRWRPLLMMADCMQGLLIFSLLICWTLFACAAYDYLRQQNGLGLRQRLGMRRRPELVRVEVRADGGVVGAPGADGAEGRGGAGGGNVGEVRVVLNLMDLLGLHSYLQLVEHAAVVVTWCSLLIGCGLWLPFTLGRYVLLAAAPLLPRAPPAALLYALLGRPEAGAPAAAVPAADPLVNTTQAYDTVAAAPLGAQSEGVAAAGSEAKALFSALARMFAELEAQVAGPGLTDWACLGVGYCALLALAVAAAAMALAWNVLRRRHGWTPSALRACVEPYVRRALVGCKVALVVSVELLLLPTAHGAFLHLCVRPLFAGVRVPPAPAALLLFSPMSTVLIHWLAGTTFIMLAAWFLSILRSLLHPDALPWLKDPYDLEDESFRELWAAPLVAQLAGSVRSFVVVAAATVAAVHLPARLAARAGVLPLRFQLVNSGGEVPADLLLFHVLFPFTLPHLHARAAMRAALGLWLRCAARLLGMADYLLPAAPPAPAAAAPAPAPPAPLLLGAAGDEGHAGGGGARDDGAELRGADEAAAAPAVNGAQPVEVAVAAAQREQELAPRVVLLCACMMVSLIVANTAILSLPLALGRAAFAAAGLPLQRHDLYAAAAGAYALWGFASVGRALAALAALRNVRRSAAVAGAWAAEAARLGALGALGVGALPLLVGLNLDLAMQPFRAPPRASLALVLWGDWAMGLLATKLAFFLAAGTPEAAARAAPGSLRARLGALRDRGWLRAPFLPTLRDVLLPPTVAAAVLLAVPAAVLRLLLVTASRAGITHASVAAAGKYAWLAEVALVAAGVGAVRARAALRRWVAQVHAERYMVGRRLNNLPEAQRVRPQAGVPASGSVTA